MNIHVTQVPSWRNCKHHAETSPFPPLSRQATAWNRWWKGRRFRVPGATPATKSWKRRLRAAWWSIETPHGRRQNANMFVKSWVMVGELKRCTLNIMFNIIKHHFNSWLNLLNHVRSGQFPVLFYFNPDNLDGSSLTQASSCFFRLESWCESWFSYIFIMSYYVYVWCLMRCHHLSPSFTRFKTDARRLADHPAPQRTDQRDNPPTSSRKRPI